MNKKVIIIGGEGNGGVIASCIEDNRFRFNDLEWEIAGFINDYEEEVCGYPVIGKLSNISDLLKERENYFMWAIHLVGRNLLTRKMFREADIPSNRLATIIHKSAFIGKDAILEPGVFVMANSYIGPRAYVGRCSVGSIMTGYSEMGLCSDLAVGSTLLAYKKVGDFAMLGANSLAVHDIPDYEIHVGSPAKFLKKMNCE